MRSHSGAKVGLKPAPKVRLKPGPKVRLKPGPKVRLKPGPKVRLPPGPEIGSALEALRAWRSPLPFLDECSRRWGDPFTVSAPNAPPWVIFSAPGAVREIFDAPADAARAGAVNSVLSPVLGPGALLLLDGPRHHRERRALSAAFAAPGRVSSPARVAAETSRVVDSWPVGRPFLLHREMQRVTFEVMLDAVLGNEGSEALDEIRGRFASFLALAANPAFLFPGIRFGDGPSAPWRRLERVRRDVCTSVDALVATRPRDRPGTDVVGRLLGDRDAALSLEAVRDHAISLLVAGHETTATALSWCVHRLLRHPGARNEAVHEVLSVAPRGIATSTEVRRLRILEATIRETLRLHAVVADVGRRLVRPRSIGGWQLPGGTIVGASAHLAHRRPESWPEPERFRPRRFLDRAPEPERWFPFGGGSRRCLGAAFASFEMKIIIATILRSVVLRRARGPIATELRGLTLAPSPGVPVVVERRRHD